MDIYIYVYGSSINHNLWFYLGSSIWMQGNSWDHNGNSNGENPWEERCNDISLNLELSRVILGVHLKSLKWVSWNKQYDILFIYSYKHIICMWDFRHLYIPSTTKPWDSWNHSGMAMTWPRSSPWPSLWGDPLTGCVFSVSSWSSQIWDGQYLIPVIHMIPHDTWGDHDS